MDDWRPQPDRHLGPQARPPAPESWSLRRHSHQAARSAASASTCRSRRRCSTGSRSSARWTPGTATTSPTRSSRPAISTPPHASTPAGKCTRRSARWSPSTTGRIGPGLPPYVAFQTSRTHIAYAGYLGQRYDPFIANRATKLPIYSNVGVDTGRTTGADLFRLPRGLTQDRLLDRGDTAG